MVPSEDYSHGPPCLAGLFGVKGERTNRTAEHKKKTMKTQNSKSQKRNEGLCVRPEQLTTAVAKATEQTPERPKIDFKRRNVNRMLQTDSLLTLMQKEAPKFFQVAEVVGKWVWIAFTERQTSQVTAALAELGFHWNNNRQTWQHPCGTIPLESADYDPRRRYGSFFPARQQPA